MNFFGHAWIAAQRRIDPGFVLGAMLPDLAPMAGLRIEALEDAGIEAGVKFHFASDAAFHRAPHFVRLVAASSRALQDAGVRRGPARGAAHVGIELLLDGWIAREHGVPLVYGEALAKATSLSGQVRFKRRTDAISLDELCQRIERSALPGAYIEPTFTGARVVRALSRRPRLALDDAEGQLVANWLSEIAPELGENAGALLAGVAETVGDAATARV